MAPPKRPWFRFYVEAFSDLKLRRVKPEHRWLFAACMGAARQSPVPGRLLITAHEPMTAADLAEYAGMQQRVVTAGIAELRKVGLVVDHEEGGWHVPAFLRRQYETDDVTARTRKHRASMERSNDADGTPMERSKGVRRNGNGTPPETETDTETRTSSSTSAAPGPCDGLDDDDPIISAAARRLAELDLERREAEAGSVGDRERWLTVVTRRRAGEVRAFVGGRPDPSTTVAQIIDALAPKAGERPSQTRVSFDETPEQHLARLVLQHDLVDDPRDREAIAEQITTLEQMLATTDR